MNGNGKTFLAAAICRAVLDRMTPLFLRHGTLMKRHRQRYELGGSSAGVSADVLAIRREGELKRLRRALGEVEALAASRAGGDDTSEEDSEAARLKAQISELEAQYAPLASASNTPALPILDACQQADLLVLDDIGRLQDGRDAEGVLHEVLDYRYNYRKPTIITVNKPEAQLAEFLGSAIFDRLEEGRFARLEFGLSSFRSQPAVNAAYLAAPPPPPTRGQPYFAAPSSAQPSAPSRQPGSALPLWMQIKYLEAEIADHRANPDSGCDRFNVTREDAQELKALRAKLAALKKQA
jgi:hypothetical protein